MSIPASLRTGEVSGIPDSLSVTDVDAGVGCQPVTSPLSEDEQLVQTSSRIRIKNRTRISYLLQTRPGKGDIVVKAGPCVKGFVLSQYVAFENTYLYDSTISSPHAVYALLSPLYHLLLGGTDKPSSLLYVA